MSNIDREESRKMGAHRSLPIPSKEPPPEPREAGSPASKRGATNEWPMGSLDEALVEDVLRLHPALTREKAIAMLREFGA